MKQNKDDDSMQLYLNATYYNSFLIDVLTGEEVVARIKKLREDGPSNAGWLH
jgi:hypothetical protein